MNNKQYIDLLIDQTKDLIWMVDHQLHLVYANMAYLNLMKEVTGVEKKVNTPILVEGFGEGYIEKWKAYYQRALSGDTFSIEEHFFHPRSNERHFGHISFSPIRDEDGKIQCVACRNTDVTSIVREKYLASSLMNSSLDVFCTIDEKANFVYVSEAAKSHWGYAPEDLVGKPYIDLILEEDVSKTNNIAEAVKSGEEIKSFFNRYRKKDGTIAYNLWSARWDKESKLMYCVAKDGKETIEQQQIIQQSEERFKALVQEGSDLIGILDLEGRYTYVSPTSTSILGIAPEAFLGKNALDFIHPDDAERTLQYLQQIAVDKIVQVPPFRFQNQEGEWRWIETVLTNLLDNPAINGIVANSRDVTEKRQEEQQLKLLSSVITNTNDAVLITEAEPVNEPGPRIIYVNEAFTKMTGYTPEEVIGKTPRILQGPKSNKEELAKLGEALRNWQPFEITTINYKKNGEEFWINFSVTPVSNENGWYTHWIAIERDVTAQKKEESEKSLLAQIATCFREDELKQAGQALCEVIRDFADFDLVELWCPNLEQTYILKTTTSTGLESFKKENNSIFQLTKGEGLPGKVWNQKKQLFWDQDRIDKSFLRKNEAQKEGLKYLLGVPTMHNKEINGVLVIGTNNDAAELEKLSEIIQNLEKFIGSEINRKRLEDDLKHLYEAIPEVLCIADFKGRFLKINPAGCELLGYTEDEILFHSFDEFTHPEDKDSTAIEKKKLEQGGTTFQFQNRYITKDGRIIWLSWNCSSSVQDGLIYATAKDITQEKELRQLSTLANTMAKIGSWEVDIEKGTVYWSEMVHLMHETNPNTFVPNLESTIQFYREDYREMVEQSVEHAINTGEAVEFEAVIVTQNLNERWVKAIGSTEVVDGVTKRFFGSFQDITDRKTIELRLKSLTDDLPGVAFQYRVSPDGKDSRHLTSKASHKIWGVSPEESERDVNIVWNQIKKGGDFEKVQESIEKSMSSGEKWHCRWRNVLPSGELRWHEGFGTPNYLPDGTVIFNSMIFDITEEKKAVLLYEETADTARMGTWEVDVKKDKVYFSKVTKEIHELEEDVELSFQDAINFYKEEYREIVMETSQDGIEKVEPWELELPIITAKGNEKWIRAIGQVQKIDDEVVRIYGSIQDIHQRKITELRLQSITNDLPGVTFQYHLFPDGTDRLYTVSKGAEKAWGLSAKTSEENINLVWEQIKKGGDYDRVVQDITHSIKTKTQWHSKWRNILPDGKVRWHEGFGTPYYQPDGTIVYNSMIFDYTEKKLATDLYEEASEMAKIGNWELNLANQEESDNMYWSPMLREILQVSDDYNPSLTGGFEFYEAGSKILIEEAVEKLIVSGTPFDLELLIRTAMGTNKWIRCIGNGEFIEDECVRIFGSFQDIHDRKTTELQLKSLTDNLPGVVFQYLLHPDGKDQILFASEGSYNVWGLSPQECIDSPEKIWQQIEAGGHLDKMVESIRKSAENLSPWHAEWLNVSLDGTKKWYEGSGLPQRLKDGSVLWNSITIDITEKKELEEKYKQSQAERATILESISDAFYAVDEDWNFTYFNKEAENLLKTRANEVLGGNIWEVFAPAKGTELEKIYRTVASSGQPENFEYFYPGDNSWYEVAAYPSNGGVAAYFKNIDVRIKAEEALEKAFKEKNEILESISDAFFAVDEDWIVTYWNSQAETILGKKKEEIVGKYLWEEYKDAIDSDFYRNYHNAMESGETITFEEYYTTLEVWVEVTVYPSENGLSVYFKDITLRKEADKRLTQANERFEKATKATNDAIWDWDIVNDTFYRSENIEKFFGKETATNLNRLDFWNDAFHPDDLKTVQKSISKALKNKQTKRWEMEYRIFNAEGSTVYVVDKGLIIRDSAGKAIRMIGAMTDITELKSANIELVRQAEFINTMTDNQLAAIVACNADGELILFNKTAKEWHGIDAIKVAQDKWAENYNLYRKDGFNLLPTSEIPLVKVFNGEEVINDEIIIKKKNDNPRIVVCNGASFYDKKGQKLGAVVVMTDITERKQSEKQLLTINKKLEIQTKELERSNEELEQFAFITSHDLQEPLRMISGFMDQLDRKYADQLDEKAKQYIHYAKDGAKRMKQVILDLLLYSRVNRPTELQESVNLNEIVSEFLLLRRKLIAEKKASVQYGQLPEMETYAAPVTQLFHCLLDNALKYTREHVSPAIIIDVADKKEFWEFAVKDNGIGIDERFYDKVFTIFQRLHNRSEYSGTGIGLSIAKRAVEFLGGEIWVESEPEAGSTFYFTIPKNLTER